MADPKRSVQEVITLLNQMKTKLDDEIRAYETEKLNVALGYSDASMKAAHGNISRMVGLIDTFIFDDSKASELIGESTDGKTDAEIETITKLNQAIKDILAKVGDIKARGVDGIDFDTNTGKVVEEVGKLDGMNTYQDAETRKAAAIGKKTGLESRIENAKKLKGIYDANPGKSKDEIIQSVYDAQAEFASIDKKTASLAEPAEYRKILAELYSGFRDGKKPYETKAGLEKLEKQIEVLKTLQGDREIDELVSELEAAIKTDSKGKKSLDPSKITAIKTKTAGCKKFNIEEKINAAKAAVVAANKTAIENLINNNAVFDFYPEKKQEWLDLLKGENPDVDAIQAEIEAAVLTGDNPGKFEEFVTDTDGDVAKLSDLEAEHREAEAVEGKLTAFGKKHVTTQTKAIFGYNLQAKNSRGEPVDIAKLDISDEDIINGLYEDFERQTEADGVTVDDVFQSDPTVPKRDKNPGFFRRAFWKISHPDSWGTGKGLADEIKENWVKAEIYRSVRDLQEDANRADGAVWTLSPEKLKEIQEADKQRAADAKEEARKAIIAGKGAKTAEDAKKQAEADAAKKQAEADRDLDL